MIACYCTAGSVTAGILKLKGRTEGMNKTRNIMRQERGDSPLRRKKKKVLIEGISKEYVLFAYFFGSFMRGEIQRY